MAAQHDEYPQYLLAPEVSALLHYVPDLHRKILFTTLWNTGARINEALALIRGNFSLAPPYPYVQLATLKQRGASGPRTKQGAVRRGHSQAGSAVRSALRSHLEIMAATLKISLERRSPETGRTEKVRLWTVTDRTMCTWLNKAVTAAAGDATLIPAQLRHAHALCGHFAEGAAEPDGAQKHKVHRGVYEGVYAGRGSPR